METKIIRQGLREAAQILRRGGLVGVPTETVYGLAGNGLDEKAVRQIYEVKGRPEVKPLALMVPDADEMERYCREVPAAAKDLAARFWPGPLSIVLKARTDLVPGIVRAGGETVSLRCPDHPMTLELLRLAGIPFAAPSANPSGEPSPKTAEEVFRYFDGQIDAVVEGGACGIGRESTILDMSTLPYKVLRTGALPAEQIADALSERMTIIGITGPSGCGKTTALKLLERDGALILDADAIYHALLKSDRALLRALEEAFPGCVKDGSLDRAALGERVFREEAELERLNAISHRFVLDELRRRLRAHAMAGGTLAAIDAIELISSGLAERCSVTIGILAEKEKRIARIMARDGISREKAELRVNAQKGDQYFVDNCDLILENNGDEKAFAIQFKEALKEKQHG